MLRINGRTFYAIYLDSLDSEIVIWGERIDESNYLASKLLLLGVKADVVSPQDDPTSYFKTILEKEHARSTKHHIIILIQDEYHDAAATLIGLGFTPGRDFKWIKRYGYERIETEYVYDPVLGFNSSGSDECPGYYILGGDEDSGSSPKKIMILGGSSTDPGSFYIKSWTEFLHELLDANGFDVKLYNGAVTGYTGSQELIKLLRDFSALRPDCVITLSGINNNHLVNGYPFMTDYQVKLGSSVDPGRLPTVNTKRLASFSVPRTPAEGFDKYGYWLNQQKTAHYYCAQYGVPYFCFLQPNLMSKDEEKLLPEEREYLANRSFMGRPGLTPQGYREITVGFRRLVESNPDLEWLFDLSDIYDQTKRSVYLDGIHVNEEGNRILSFAIYSRLVDCNIF